MPSMKAQIGIITLLFFGCVLGQDTTYFYSGWGKPINATYVALDSLNGRPYTELKLVDENPVLLKQFNAKKELQGHTENEFDQYGNHKAQRIYDGAGRLREEMIFQNDPTEMTLFKTIFGDTFVPANSNFMIRREYNDFERETGYYIIGIRGQTLCSKTTLYRDDRRKDREILKDDLKEKILIERRYKYIDAENRTVLEEFNGEGKMVQRVVLFDHHDIIQE